MRVTQADPCPGEPCQLHPGTGQLLSWAQGLWSSRIDTQPGQFAFHSQLLPTDFTCTDTRGQTGSVLWSLLKLNLKALSHCSAGAEPDSTQPGDPATGLPVRAQLLPLDSPQLQQGPGSSLPGATRPPPSRCRRWMLQQDTVSLEKSIIPPRRLRTLNKASSSLSRGLGLHFSLSLSPAHSSHSSCDKLSLDSQLTTLPLMRGRAFWQVPSLQTPSPH